MIEWLRDHYMIPVNVILWSAVISIAFKDYKKE